MTASTPQLSEPIAVRPLKSEADYLAALAEIEELLGVAEPDSPAGDKLELLITLVETYENQHYPLGESSDPVSLIEFVMEQQGLSRKDLETYIGPRQRVWDILERRRPLSLAMIRRLEKGLHIPAHLLIREYPLLRSAA
jgi:HTH-type transcriptional regulator / antitoxin HigA